MKECVTIFRNDLADTPDNEEVRPSLWRLGRVENLRFKCVIHPKILDLKFNETASIPSYFFGENSSKLRRYFKCLFITKEHDEDWGIYASCASIGILNSPIFLLFWIIISNVYYLQELCPADVCFPNHRIIKENGNITLVNFANEYINFGTKCQSGIYRQISGEQNYTNLIFSESIPKNFPLS
ncbi:unnamed protein product [Hymenolepis diminuta]|uniref:Uncharacterized protein n=1 Tax=Hymenolepis diminuta TaxID=6216 RepID=A0A564YX01_HYMDI|nr:unnamed protein product [Hymenolepis diminuta]